MMQFPHANEIKKRWYPDLPNFPDFVSRAKKIM